MAQKDESIRQIKKDEKIFITEEQEAVLRSVGRSGGNNFSEIIIHYGSELFTVGRCIVDPYSVMLYSSKAEHYSYIKKLIDVGESVENAVDQAVKYFSKR